MRVVYKYPIAIEDDIVIEIPKGALFLHFGEHRGELSLWALVDPDKLPIPYTFRLAGTGHHVDIHKIRGHIGTVTNYKNMLVWHLFEMRD